MKFITQTKFWQLPAALKLVVIWLFLLGLNSFWQSGNTMDLAPLIRGIIELALAIGLINRSNESRSWTAFFMFLGILFSLFLLCIAIFKDTTSMEGFNISYEKFAQSQVVIFLMVYFIINAAVLYILLRPKTKAFFSSESSE